MTTSPVSRTTSISWRAKKVHYPAVIDKDPMAISSRVSRKFSGLCQRRKQLDAAVLGCARGAGGHVLSWSPTRRCSVALLRLGLWPTSAKASNSGHHNSCRFFVAPAGQMQRVNITMDEGLLDEIDANLPTTDRASWRRQRGGSLRGGLQTRRQVQESHRSSSLQLLARCVLNRR